MATIDELVTKISFEVDERGLRKLRSVDDVTGSVGESAEKMGKGFDRAGKDVKDSIKSTDALAASFTKIALAAASAISVGAAMRFTLGAADEAKDLTDLATSLGENTGELHLFGAAMRAAGRDAKAFFNDFKKIQSDNPWFTLDDVYKDAERLRDLKDDLERQGKNAVPIVINEASAMGYSEQSALWLMQGKAAIKERVDNSRRLGHGVSDEQIEKGDKLSRSYSNLAETVSNLAKKFGYEVSPAVTAALDAITEKLGDNQERIAAWAKSANKEVGLFVQAMTGDLGKAGDEISKFNGKLASENARDPDPEVRQQNYEELQKKSFWQAARATAGALWDTGETLVSGHFGIGRGVLTGDLGKIESAIADTYGNISSIFGNLWDDYGKIATPLRDAQKADFEARHGPDIYRKMKLAEQYEANPELREQAYEQSRLEVGAHFEREQSKRSYGLMFGRPRVFSSLTEAERAYHDDNSSPALPMPELSLPYTPSLGDIPAHGRNEDQRLMDELRGAMAQWTTPSAPLALPPEYLAAMSGVGAPGNEGVTIERQEVNIRIDGAGQNAEEISTLTVAKLRAAARMSDYAPRSR